MKNVLWFSRHELTETQIEDLKAVLGEDDLFINCINQTITSAYAIKDDLERCDVACVVMPLNLQEQTLKILNGKPMLISRNHRVQQDDGTFAFYHAGWDRVDRIEIVKETLSNIPAPDNSFRQ